MDKDSLERDIAVFLSGYVKRWLKTHYDGLAELPAFAQLREESSQTQKYFIELLLNALSVYVDRKISDQTPFGFVFKAAVMDGASEISARLIKDHRADLSKAASSATQERQRSVWTTMLALDDDALFALLVQNDRLDPAGIEKFLEFAADASEAELRRFISLDPQQRESLLGIHQRPRAEQDTGATHRSFLEDYWDMVKGGLHRTVRGSQTLLRRYVAGVMEVMKTSVTLVAVALIVCLSAPLFGRWALLAILLGVVGGCSVLWYIGRRKRKRWLSAAGMMAAAVTALLSVFVAAGYPEAVFAIAMFFLVGLPTLAIVAVLIPAAASREVLRKLSPEGYKTLVRATQMLVVLFSGLLLSSAVLLIAPPQNPVAFLVVAPAVVMIALMIALRLARVNPEVFLSTPVLLSLGALMLLAMGMMSMPNVWQKVRLATKNVDLSLVNAPAAVTFSSSADIDFVDPKSGEARIWYAARSDGGYDLFHAEGVGPYFAKDGRRLTKAESNTIRSRIAAWVDSDAAAKTAALQRALVEEAARDSLERARIANEQRQAARELEAQQERDAQRVAGERRESQALADRERRAGYLATTELPSKVTLIVCAATGTGQPMDGFSEAIASHFEEQGSTATSIVFSPGFVTGGGFDAFFSGLGRTDVQNMPLSRMGERILLARVSVSAVTESLTTAGLVSASVVAGFKILSSSDGSLVDAFQLEAVGPGTSEADATSAALNRILDQLRRRKP